MPQSYVACAPESKARILAVTAWLAGADAAARFVDPIAPYDLPPVARALWLLSYTLMARRMSS